MTTTRKKIPLACGHDLWYEYVPQVSEELWCTRCRTYVSQQHAQAAFTSYELDGWESSRIGSKFHGTCRHCARQGKETVLKNSNWNKLDSAMNAHILQSHTHSGLKFERISRGPLPKDPDF